MSGRHRKPTPSVRHLARVGTLTVLATAPLAVTGTAFAASATGHQHGGSTSPDRESARHGSDDYWDDDAPVWSSDEDVPRWDDDRTSHATDDTAGRADDTAGSAEDATERADRASSSRADQAGERAERVTRHADQQATRATVQDAKWDQLAQCESARNWNANTGNGYRGGLQFTDATWRRYGGTQYAPSANQASREEQIAVAKKVQQAQGWQAWPSCSHRLGYA